MKFDKHIVDKIRLTVRNATRKTESTNERAPLIWRNADSKVPDPRELEQFPLA